MLLDHPAKSVSRLGGASPAPVAPEQIGLVPAPRPPPPAQALLELGPALAVSGSAVTDLLVFALTALVCFSCVFLYLLLSRLGRKLLAAPRPPGRPSPPAPPKARSLHLPELTSIDPDRAGPAAPPQSLGRDSLMQALHQRFRKRMSAQGEGAAEEAAEGAADFLENGKFGRTFTLLERLDRGGQPLFKVLHRFEGKKYLVRQVAVRTAGRQLRGHELVQRLAAATEFCHPCLARYVTYWAEAGPELPPRASRSRSEHSDGPGEWAPQARSLQSVGEAGGPGDSVRLFIQSELCAGSSLAEQLASLALNSQDVFHIFTKVLEAVGYLNARGARPARLSLDSVRLADGEVRLTDFLPTGPADDSAERQSLRLGELLLQLLCRPGPARPAEPEAVAFLSLLLRGDGLAVGRLLESREYAAWRDAVLQSFIVSTGSN